MSKQVTARFLRRVPADYRPLLRAALADGWTAHPRRRHVLLRHPDGIRTACVPCSPSDHRARANLTAALARHAS